MEGGEGEEKEINRKIAPRQENGRNTVKRGERKKAIKKKDARPFKVPKNIIMMVINPINGEKTSFR